MSVPIPDRMGVRTIRALTPSTLQTIDLIFSLSRARSLRVVERILYESD
jgi:hypothetical protein